LKAAGVRAQDFVSVLLPRGYELVVSVLAIWKAGAVYVPLDPDFPADRLAIYVQVSVSSPW
jgi:non-ribosomal peptide synthetase component F